MKRGTWVEFEGLIYVILSNFGTDGCILGDSIEDSSVRIYAKIDDLKLSPLNSQTVFVSTISIMIDDFLACSLQHNRQEVVMKVCTKCNKIHSLKNLPNFIGFQGLTDDIKIAMDKLATDELGLYNCDCGSTLAIWNSEIKGEQHA